MGTALVERAVLQPICGKTIQMAMSPSQMPPLVKLVRQYLVSLLPKHQPNLRLRFQTVATLSTTKIVFILALTPVPVPRPGFLTGQGMTVSSWGENVPLTSLLAVNQPNVWVTTTTLLVFRSPKLHLILPKPQLLLLHVPFVMINQLKVRKRRKR